MDVGQRPAFAVVHAHAVQRCGIGTGLAARAEAAPKIALHVHRHAVEGTEALGVDQQPLVGEPACRMVVSPDQPVRTGQALDHIQRAFIRAEGQAVGTLQIVDQHLQLSAGAIDAIDAVRQLG